MNNITYAFDDPHFKCSHFHEFITALTPKICENLETRLNRETLAIHLNYLLCAPDPEELDLGSLAERQDYCQDFSAEISVGNINLVLQYVYLAPDLTPHWAFKINIELSDASEIECLIDTTEHQLYEFELGSYQDESGKDLPLDIHSTFWRQEISAQLDFLAQD